jgi:uncharacterized repeat protein (TIGR01451 family)
MKKKLKESLSILLLIFMLVVIGLLPGKPAKSDNSTVSLLTYGDAGHGGDDTAILQAALDAASGQSWTLLVPVGTYLVKPLFVRNNTSLELASGVVIQAAAGYDVSSSLMTIQDVTNVTINGYGATLTMPKAEYTSGEQRHALAILGSTNVTIQGLSCNNSGGDGILIAYGSAPLKQPSKDIVIQDVTCDNNRRDGMSIISVQNLLVSHCRLTNSNGEGPQSGIDIEPDHTYDQLTNVRIEDSVTADNMGAGVIVSLHSMDNTSPPVSITESNLLDQNESQSGFVIMDDAPVNPVTGTVTLTNCTSQSPGRWGLDIYDIDGPSISVSGLAIANPDQVNSSSYISGITEYWGTGDTCQGGNVSIPSSTISDSTGKMQYYFAVYDYTAERAYRHLSIPHGTWSGAVDDPYGYYVIPGHGTQVTSLATDPAITKSVDNSSASSGAILTYTISYSNSTSPPKTFTNAKIEDPIPNGTTFDSSSNSGTSDGTKVVWNIGNLAPGASSTVTFQVKVN